MVCVSTNYFQEIQTVLVPFVQASKIAIYLYFNRHLPQKYQSVNFAHVRLETAETGTRDVIVWGEERGIKVISLIFAAASFMLIITHMNAPDVTLKMCVTLNLLWWPWSGSLWPPAEGARSVVQHWSRKGTTFITWCTSFAVLWPVSQRNSSLF